MKKLEMFAGLTASTFILIAATPPPNTYPQSVEFKDTVTFETIVVGDGGHVDEPFRILDHSKKISFAWTREGKKIKAIIADRMWDEYVEKDPEAADAGCLDICVFKNGRWKVTTVFFPTMYRQDGRIGIHESYPIPENLVWYENGEFHFAECSMVLVDYKRALGMLETENKIAGLNAFLSIWYWPYLTFESKGWEPVNYQIQNRGSYPNLIERPKVVFGKRTPYTGVLP